MARIAGIDLPRDKRIEIGLSIFMVSDVKPPRYSCSNRYESGYQRKRSHEDDVSKLREYIDRNYRVEGDLRRDIAFDIKRLIEISAIVVFVTARACP